MAARFARGQVAGVWIFSGEGGVTLSSGIEWVSYYPAGYMGVPLITTLFILFSGFLLYSPLILGSTGGLLMLMYLIFGRRDTFSGAPVARVVTTLAWVPISVMLIGIAWFAASIWSVMTLNLLAVLGTVESFRALNRLSADTRAAMAQRKPGASDPEQMAKYFASTPFLKSPMFWVRIWYLFAIVVIGAAYWLIWFGGAPVLAQG